MRSTITTGIAMNASVEMMKPSSVASCSGRCENDEIASSEKRSILRERVLRLAGVARVAVVGDGGLRVADPHGHAAQEAVALAHRQQRVERRAVEQAEVARVVLQLDLGELVEQPVEPARGRELEARLALALLAHGVDDVAAGAPVIEHLRDQLGRVLQVGVEHHDGVAAGVVEPGGQRRLVAEVARQVDRRARAGRASASSVERSRRAVASSRRRRARARTGCPSSARAHARVELLDRAPPRCRPARRR